MSLRRLERDRVSLVGLGVGPGGDHYLDEGIHLRWSPDPMLGFPRRGYRLSRRSALDWPWTKRSDVLFVDLARLPVVDGRRIGDGLIVTGGRSGPRGALAVTVEASVRFYQSDYSVPRPAAYVALILTGPADATVDVVATETTGDDRTDIVLDRVSGTLGALPVTENREIPGLVGRRLMVDGGYVGEIGIRASAGVVLEAIYWIDALRTLDDRDWSEPLDFLLPIAGDGVHYTAQSASAARALMKPRLWASLHLALPPYVEARWPPPKEPPNVIDALWGMRCLQDVASLQGHLSSLLDEELRSRRPQGKVRLEGAGLGTDAQVDAFSFPALGMILLNAIEPCLAHLLGLAVRDNRPHLSGRFDVPFDYRLEARYPKLWLEDDSAALARTMSADAYRKAIVPPPEDDGRDDRFVTSCALATNLDRSRTIPVPSPTMFAARVRPIPGRAPINASAELEWTMIDPPDLASPGRLATTLRRVDAIGDLSIAGRDPDTGLPLLRIAGFSPDPADDAGARARPSGVSVARDTQLRSLGRQTYRVFAMDVWGRWSAPAETVLEIDDPVSPPAPSGLEAAFDGQVRRDDRVERLVLDFDWSRGSATLAPDTVRFDISVREGTRDAADVLAAPDQQGMTSWPGLHTNAPVEARAVDDGDGGHRLTVTLGDVLARRVDLRHEASVVVEAIDAAGRRSRPSRVAVARRIDPVPVPSPPGEPDVVLSTWPDASGYGYYRVSWPPMPDDTRVQVMRAAEARLLAAAGEPPDAHDALSRKRRAGNLRRLARAHPFAFSPDHAVPYSAADGMHLVGLRTGDRGLCTVVIIPTGPSGTRAAWPTDESSFTVIALRGTVRPPLIRLVATRAARGGVTLTMTTDAVQVTLYRASDPAQAQDVRAMRPIERTAPEPDGQLTVADPNVLPGRWYVYRAIGENADGRRSAPTTPTWIQA